jgi:hypothetical protein
MPINNGEVRRHDDGLIGAVAVPLTSMAVAGRHGDGRPQT